MQDVSRTLVKTLFRQIARLPHQSTSKRLRAPIILGYWGQGGKLPSRNVADRILAAFPTLQKAPGFENILSEHIQPYLTTTTTGTQHNEDDVDDFVVLRSVVRSIIKARAHPHTRDELDLWIQQGFDAHRALALQYDLWLGSCITKTNGLYVDVTSTFHPALTATLPNDNYMFAYAIYIENQSDRTLQVLGRHWKIFSTSTPHSVEEVQQLDQGLVGHQPKLEPGESFYYVSGAQLDSFRGEMSGELSVREYPNVEEENGREKNFLAQVGPFDLVAPER